MPSGLPPQAKLKKSPPAALYAQATHRCGPASHQSRTLDSRGIIAAMSSFHHLGLFPFCFKRVESVNEIDTEIAESVEGYAGSYVGTLFPLKLNLQQAMDLFWRVKTITVDFSYEYESEPTDDGFQIFYTDVTTSKAEIKEFSAIDEYDSMKKRVCGFPTYLQYTTLSTSSDSSGFNSTSEIQRKIFWFSDSAITDAINGAFDKPVESSYDLPRGIIILQDGKEERDPRNYDYYPTILIPYSQYGDYWTTWHPHTTYESGIGQITTTTGLNVTVSLTFTDFDGNNISKEITFYQVLYSALSGFTNYGTTTISSPIDVELWEPPN